MRHWLIEIRKAKGMSQDEVARLASISRSYYVQIENGTRGKSLRVPVAKAIAAALEIEWTRFYEE